MAPVAGLQETTGLVGSSLCLGMALKGFSKVPVGHAVFSCRFTRRIFWVLLERGALSPVADCHMAGWNCLLAGLAHMPRDSAKALGPHSRCQGACNRLGSQCWAGNVLGRLFAPFSFSSDKATSIHRTHRGCFQPLSSPRWPSVICQAAE